MFGYWIFDRCRLDFGFRCFCREFDSFRFFHKYMVITPARNSRYICPPPKFGQFRHLSSGRSGMFIVFLPTLRYRYSPAPHVGVLSEMGTLHHQKVFTPWRVRGNDTRRNPKKNESKLNNTVDSFLRRQHLIRKVSENIRNAVKLKTIHEVATLLARF